MKTRLPAPEDIWAEAKRAAQAAAEAENDRLPPEQQRGFDCGFAWVVIKPARGRFVRFAKDHDLGYVRSWGGGGYELWYSHMHDLQTQSVSVHMAAARACAEVLTRHGLNCYADQRLD